MARALNKNKKPESKIKIEHATTFLGSFGSPCSFWRLACSRELALVRVRSAGTISETLKSLALLRSSTGCNAASDIPFKRLRSFLHHPPTKC